MTIVSSRTQPAAHAQTTGLRRVVDFYTDHLGVESAGYRIEVPESYTEIEHSARRLANYSTIEQGLASTEIQSYISMLEQGIDVYSLIPNHQTDVQVFSEVTKFFIQLDIETLTIYHQAIPHLSNLTNPQITSYGINWTEFNNWMSDADTLKVAINNYNPMVV